MGLTISEKILSRVCGRTVTAGDLVFPEPELVTVHDWYAANVGQALDEFGVTSLFDPSRVMFVTDHEPIAVSPHAAARQKAVRDVVRRFKVGHFFDAGRGGHGHVFPVEKGFVRPGMYIQGYDTHVTNYGAVGALGVAVLTEVTETLALGSIWQTIPETVRIDLKGQLPPGVTIRDAAQGLLRVLDPDQIDDAVVEFGGAGAASLGVDARFTLCNTPTEIGARSTVCEPDDSVAAYLADRVDGPLDLVTSDAEAVYRDRIEYDLSACEPQVSAPPRPENVVGISQVAGTAIDHAYIGSCASGMLQDMREAAGILKGRRIAPRVRLFVTPATDHVAETAAREGLLEIFYQAGAILTQPGCGVCAGGRVGPVTSGEVSIGTGTRNDPGRLGAHDAQLYLASPATVAASALRGEIVDPRHLGKEA